MMENKENDLLLTMINNPEFTFEEMQVAGLNIDNTSLNTREAYKERQDIQDKFKDKKNGEFDDETYNKYYDMAVYGYNVMANTSFDQALERILEYDKDNIYASTSKKKYEPNFSYVKVANPFRQNESMVTLGRRQEPTKTFDEIAQSNKVLTNPTEVYKNDGTADWSKAVWHEAPENDFFEDFWDTRVIAQYDEDGEHVDPITGETVKHKKGDLRLNEQGTFYYENLDGRDVYGRRVLNKLNVITKEDSKLNNYDFFDSDDLNQKSITGNVIKNLALVGSMFIPYVGPWIAGASVLTQLTGLVGTLGKMLTDSENDTFSALEGWSKSLSRQNLKTQYAQENTWCWENFVNLIGDVAGQLKEQRFIFDYGPAIFKGTTGISSKSQKAAQAGWEKALNKSSNKTIEQLLEEGSSKGLLRAGELAGVNRAKAASMLQNYMKSYNNIGSAMSKAYMTAITVGDTYGEAKLSGATDDEAMWLTLGYAAGELAILNSPLGEWILPELRADSYKFRAIRKAALNSADDVAAANKKVWKKLKDESSREYSRRLFDEGKSLAKKVYGTGIKTLGAAAANALGEGLEEVTEEFLADFSKACFNYYKRTTGDPTVQMDAWSNMFDRYSMSLLGGFIGGGLTHLGTDYKMFTQYDKMTSQQAVQELVYMARNGELKNFIKSVNKETILPTSLSATKFTSEGLPEPGTADDNQDQAAKKAIIMTAKMIQDIIDAEGAALDDDTFLDNQVRGDFKMSALANTTSAGRMLQEFNTLTKKVTQLSIKLQELSGVKTDSQERKEKNNPESDKDILKVTQDLSEARKELKDLLDGKRAAEFLTDAVFESSTALRRMFVPDNFQMYAEFMSKKKFTDLNDKEKSELAEKYNNYIKSGMKDDVHAASQIFLSLIQGTGDAVSSMSKLYETLEESPELNNLVATIQQLRQVQIPNLSEQEWLAQQQTNANTEASNVALQLVMEARPEVYGDILQRMANIANTEFNSDNDRDAEYKALNYELQQAITEDIISEISKTVKKFQDVGYINSSVKNRLIDVIKEYRTLFELKKVEAEETGDMWGAEEYAEKEDSLIMLASSLQELKHTPMEDFINQFSLTVTGKPLYITELLENVDKVIGDFKDDVTALTLTDQMSQQIDSALELLNMFGAVVYAARTDNATAENAFGYSATLNKINKGEEGWKPLLEVEASTVDVMMQDLTLYRARLQFAKDLFNVNSGQTLSMQNRVGINTNKIIYKKLKQFINALPIEDDEDLKKLIQKLETFTLLATDKSTLTEVEEEQMTKEMVELQDAVYDFFNSGNNLSQDKLSKMLRYFNLYTTGEDILTADSADVDDNAFIWWLAARASVKSSQFYYMYKAIINEKIAPVPTQELAVYMNYASVVRGNVFTQFMNAKRQAIKDDWKTRSESSRKEILTKLGSEEDFSDKKFDDYIFNLVKPPQFSNVVLTEGIPGSGKTTGVLETTIAMLEKFNKEVLSNVAVLHIDDKRADKLGKDCNLKNFKGYSFLEYLKSIIINYEAPQYKDGQCEIHDYRLSEENDIEGNYKLKATSTTPSLIIIDEVTKLNHYELEAINNFAKAHGIQVLACGDYDQAGVEARHSIADLKVFGDKAQWNVSTDRRAFAGLSFKLGVSMRVGNKQADQNNKTVQAFIQKQEDVLPLHYYKDDTGLYGDQIVTARTFDASGKEVFNEAYMESVLHDIDLMLADIDAVNAKKEKDEIPEKLTYVFNDTSSALYNELSSDKYKDKIDFKVGSTAQGLEGMYYVVDLNSQKYKEGSSYWKELYTAITRRSKGSILITGEKYIDPKSRKTAEFKDIPDQSTVQKNISKETYANYAKQRKAILDKIIGEQEVVKVEDRIKEGTLASVKETSDKETLKEGSVEEEVKDPVYQEVPVTGTDIIPEKDYKEQIDASSETPEVTHKVQRNKQIELAHYSHNTLELGVEVATNERGEKVIVPSQETAAKYRLDSINGLRKLPKFKNYTLEQFENLLCELRNIIFTTSDKTELHKKLGEKLGISDIYCTFGVKSRANSTDIDRWNNWTSKDSRFWKFFRSIGEKLFFNRSNDVRSDQLQLHTLSIVISSDSEGHKLELPLQPVPNPRTVMFLKDEDGEHIFPEAIRLWEQNNHLKFSEKVQLLKQTLQNDPDYKVLTDLCTIFRFTKNDFFPIKDDQWTIARNMQVLGPQFSTSKGLYQEIEGLDYEADWTPINDYANDPQFKVSPVLISRYSMVEGVDHPIIRAGHPFVLVSQDKSLTVDQMADYYIQQEANPDLPVKVIKVYALPPKASIDSWVANLFDIINNKRNEFSIGDVTTSYKILKILTKDERFLKAAGKIMEIDHVVSAVKAIEEIEPDLDNKGLQKQLYQTENWADKGGQNKSIARSGLFDGVIKNFVYPTTGGIVGSASSSLNQANLDLIKTILQEHNVTGVYYSTRIPILEKAIRIGESQQFIVANQKDNFKMETREGLQDFLIHGKIDSYAFITVKPENSASMTDIYGDIAQRMETRDALGGEYSADLQWYLGKGIRTNTGSDSEVDPELPAKNNLIEQLRGIVDRQVIEDYYNEHKMDGMLRHIITYINSSDIPRFAFSPSGTNLYVTEENEEFKSQTIQEAYETQEGSFIVLSNGCSLEFSDLNDGVVYLRKDAPSEKIGVIDVNIDNLQQYSDVFEILTEEEGLPFDDMLGIVDPSEFIVKLENLNLDEDTKQIVIEALENQKQRTPDLEVILQSLINRLSDETEQKLDNCNPIPINVKKCL